MAILYTICFLFATYYNDTNAHIVSVARNFSILKGKSFSLIVNNDEIGFLDHVEIPILKWYILHSFFVKKEYRSKGYGKYLLQSVLSDIVFAGASKVFIQPGPFEHIGGHFVSIDKNERDERIKQIIRLYKYVGFHFANNKYLSICLNLVYKVLCINENPTYFMIYDVSKLYDKKNIAEKL